MMRIVFVCLALAFSTSAFAGFPADFDRAIWNRIVDKAINEGEAREVMPGEEIRSLSQVVPADPTLPRQADYFSVTGYKSATDPAVFRPMGVSAVSETWKEDSEGNWVIEQWIYSAELNGNLRRIIARHLTLSKEGRYLGDKRIVHDGAEGPETLAKWGKFLELW